MVAERVGSIDSSHYIEVNSNELPLAKNNVEVELYASAHNFKDGAMKMGMLELEGVGVIRRVGNGSNSPSAFWERNSSQPNNC